MSLTVTPKAGRITTSSAPSASLRSPGSELLVFTSPGALFRVAPTGPHGTFETELLAELPGRIRDAVVLPGDAAPEIATVARTGEGALLDEDEKTRLTVYAREVVPAGLPLIAGASADSTRAPIPQAKALAQAGADAALEPAAPLVSFAAPDPSGLTRQMSNSS